MPIAEWTDSGRPVTRSEIEGVAARSGVTFPDQYVEFLRAHNGGRPRLDEFRGIDPDDEGVVDFFFQIGGSYYTDLEGHITGHRESGDAHPDLVPIARTPSGALICLGPEGAVYLWWEEALARSAQGWKLAVDLTSFLRSLH